jgi:hypothetical protein
MDARATQGKVKLFNLYTMDVDEARALARDILTAAYTAETQDRLLRELYVAERNGITHKEK